MHISITRHNGLFAVIVNIFDLILICCLHTAIYNVFQQKAWYRTFAITLSTVNRFWKFFHCWKQTWIINKI